MCGICGIVYSDRERPVSPQLLESMRETMKHRGPDEAGLYVHQNVGLGHRRLSIIDLATGRQPLSNEDETLWITFNGEIYNYRELTVELEGFGHRFKTRSDTEAVVHAYEQWGEGCLARLRGMFAFAIHDRRANRLFVARDRMGIKPLYYHVGPRGFAFASEVKALLASDLVAAHTDAGAIESFAAVGYVPGPRTLFDGVRKLMPGHYATYDERGLRIAKYWDFNNVTPAEGPREELIERLRARLQEAVRLHLVSDVPLGVFLSGGLDSSAVVALMHNLPGTQIRTFSVGYRGAAEADELSYARAVARHFETDHHEFVLEPERFFDSLEQMVRACEEPVVEPAAIALYHIARQAKGSVTVALCGEGADEILGGYTLYRKAIALDRLAGRLAPLRPALRAAERLAVSEKAKKYLHWLGNPAATAYRGTSYDAPPSVRAGMFERSFLDVARREPYLDECFGGWFDAVAGRDLLSQLLYVDARTWLVDDLLLKADKMSMAASLELRVPFLDHEVVELAASLPADLKIHDGRGKVALRRIMESSLPPEILNRPKQGFPVPVRRWFQTDILDGMRDLLLGPEARARGYFRPAYVERVLDEHARGRRDFSRRIMTLAVLELWHRAFIER